MWVSETNPGSHKALFHKVNFSCNKDVVPTVIYMRVSETGSGALDLMALQPWR